MTGVWNSGRDAQHLARIDLVRVAQHRLVGLEDFHVGVGVAVLGLGDARQGVAAHDGVVARLVGRRGNGQHVVDGGDAGDVAAAQQDLFLRGLVGRAARDGGLAGGAVKGDLQTIDVQALGADVLLDRSGCASVGRGELFLRGHRICSGRGFSGGLFRVVAAEELLAGFLDETHQSHGLDSFCFCIGGNTTCLRGASMRVIDALRSPDKRDLFHFNEPHTAV